MKWLLALYHRVAFLTVLHYIHHGVEVLIVRQLARLTLITPWRTSHLPWSIVHFFQGHTLESLSRGRPLPSLNLLLVNQWLLLYVLLVIDFGEQSFLVNEVIYFYKLLVGFARGLTQGHRYSFFEHVPARVHVRCELPLSIIWENGVRLLITLWF